MLTTITHWQKEVYKRNRQKGFYDYQGDLELVRSIPKPDSASVSSDVFQDEYQALQRILADYEQCMLERKLLLAIGELVEAHEEIRAGHAPTDVYYSHDGTKPEGFGIELADAQIRLLDLAEAAGVDSEYMMNQKHLYNESRPYKHGRQF